MTNLVESRETLALVAANASEWNRVLYIGWHPSITHWSEDGNGGDWYIHEIKRLREGRPTAHTIVERHKPYCDALVAHPLSSTYSVRCIHADVARWARETSERFDLIIWWHGPEHVSEADLIPTIEALEKIGRCVVLGGPEGKDYYEETSSGDAHRCVLSRKQFEELGYQTILFDRTERGQGPHVSAVKIV